jgi:hypothetical protein
VFSFKKYMESFTALHEVNIDNRKGMGAVSNNQEIDYFGLRVQMKPSTFLDLAAKTNSKPTEEMLQYIKNGGAIGAPFLIFEVPDEMSDSPKVIGHEGRHRMMAVKEIEGDKPIEVHIFPKGFISRKKHINKDIEKYLNKSAYKEDTNQLIRGPLWK